jgi:hypothetical protein
MKRPALASFLFALGAQLSAQSVHFAAASSSGSSGTVCDPVTCTPAPVAAPRGDQVVLTVGGAARHQPCFLLLALPPAQCSSIPGIAGPLILVPPAEAVFVPLLWARVYVSAPPGSTTCSGWMGFAGLPIPMGMPTGRLLMQVLADSPTGSGSQWTLSNAVELTVQ